MHPAAWNAVAAATATNVRQADWGKVCNLVARSTVTGPGGAPFGAPDIVVNCPIISSD